MLVTHQPFSHRNADQMKAYWKISSISEKSENGGKLNFFVLQKNGNSKNVIILASAPSYLCTLHLILYPADQFNFSLKFLLRDSVKNEMLKYK